MARKTISASNSVVTQAATTPGTPQSYSAAVTRQETPTNQKESSAIIPVSPNQSISTITTSQQSQQLVEISQSPDKSAASALALFRAETEKEFAAHAETTLSSLQLFKNEMIRANENATKFRNSLIEAQQHTNANIATLQESQQQANQRLQALETNMDFTVNGIRELLEKK